MKGRKKKDGIPLFIGPLRHHKEQRQQQQQPIPRKVKLPPPQGSHKQAFIGPLLPPGHPMSQPIDWRFTDPFHFLGGMSLKAILREDFSEEEAARVIERFNKEAIKCYRLKKHATMFLKAFALARINPTFGDIMPPYIDANNVEHPIDILSVNFIQQIMKVLCINQPRANTGPLNQHIQRHLSEFYANHYSRYIVAEEWEEDNMLNYEHMGEEIIYMSREISQMYLTNIQQHQPDHVDRMINVVYQKKQQIEHLKRSFPVADRSAKINAFLRELQLIKDCFSCVSPEAAVLQAEQTLTHEQYMFVYENAWHILPNYVVEGTRAEDIKNNPQAYLDGMIHMMMLVEVRKGVALIACPLITALKPGFFRVDTIALMNIFGWTSVEDCTANASLKAVIWGRICKIGDPCFHRNGGVDAAMRDYVFDWQMVCNGESVHLMYVHKDLANVHFRDRPNFPTREPATYKYIHLLTEEEIESLNLRERPMVAIDPNMRDQYCINHPKKNKRGFEKHQHHHRHTQNTMRKARHVTRNRRTRERMKRLKEATQGPIQGYTVDQWEQQMSQFNSKSILNFGAYLTQKNRMDFFLSREFYNNPIFRKLQRRSLRGRIRSESQFANSLKRTYGKDVVVCIGDFSQTNFKHHEPTTGKRYRHILAKAGIDVFLVDEFRTSRQCSCCADKTFRGANGLVTAKVGNDIGKCKTFRKVKNPRPNQKPGNKRKLCHGLLRCCTCARLWNRDVNAAINIWKIAHNAIFGKGRPRYLRRSDRLQRRYWQIPHDVHQLLLEDDEGYHPPGQQQEPQEMVVDVVYDDEEEDNASQPMDVDVDVEEDAVDEEMPANHYIFFQPIPPVPPQPPVQEDQMLIVEL